MKGIWIKAAFLFIAVWSTESKSNASSPSCPPLTQPELLAVLDGRSTTEVIFFASWCHNCKDKLIGLKKREDAILIASFDEATNTLKALRGLDITTPCYTDAGITKHYGIKSLPASLWWREGKLR